MKYCLSPQEIPRAPASEFPSCSGNISSYIPPLVTIQLQAIRNQEEGGLAREIVEEQLTRVWLGLGKEVAEICVYLKLIDASRMEVQKETIKKAVWFDHLKSVKKKLKVDKLQEMARSDISSRRLYTAWSLDECWKACRLETRMFKCRANMPKLFKIVCRS